MVHSLPCGRGSDGALSCGDVCKAGNRMCAMRSAVVIPMIALMLLPLGCRQSGPATVHANSAALATLQARIDLLNQYVTFRRTYETLDFDLMYVDNSRGVPATNTWDIRLVATVPEAELAAWIPAVPPRADAPNLDWLQAVPTALDLSGVTEWYEDGNRTVGVDRARRIVVWRDLGM